RRVRRDAARPACPAALRQARGSGRRRRLPRQPRGLLRDRDGPQCRWRFWRLIVSTKCRAQLAPGCKLNCKEYPMIELKPFAKLGGADHGWLKAKHHFSFASYYDPENMGHGSLRVWNDDEIAPNTGFPAHPHANMEIITYVREGAITHQDSLGNKGRAEAG